MSTATLISKLHRFQVRQESETREQRGRRMHMEAEEAKKSGIRIHCGDTKSFITFLKKTLNGN
jgi:hypothetical protein